MYKTNASNKQDSMKITPQPGTTKQYKEETISAHSGGLSVSESREHSLNDFFFFFFFC